MRTHVGSSSRDVEYIFGASGGVGLCLVSVDSMCSEVRQSDRGLHNIPSCYEPSFPTLASIIINSIIQHILIVLYGNVSLK